MIDVRQKYFNWLINQVYDRTAQSKKSKTSFMKLLIFLNEVVFEYVMEEDENRYTDGVDLRGRFAYYEHEDDSELTGPCTVLEMMIALSIRIEEDIMDDDEYGNRIGQWFWEMIVSLGLGSMTDEHYDEIYITEVIDNFLNRRYEPNGKGGLFTIRDIKDDLRDVEIWYQMCWYLNSIS